MGVRLSLTSVVGMVLLVQYQLDRMTLGFYDVAIHNKYVELLRCPGTYETLYNILVVVMVGQLNKSNISIHCLEFLMRLSCLRKTYS